MLPVTSSPRPPPPSQVAVCFDALASTKPSLFYSRVGFKKSADF